MMSPQTQFVKVLDKGLITLPKAWRTDLQLTKGAMLQARKMNRSIIIESITVPAANQAKVPYRVYSSAELKQFLKADTL